ncbi:MAG: esterase family protein [Thermomicrobiaceae bacterium]|nr:esterase family protein [Thermomicrobiaceae bacterium]
MQREYHRWFSPSLGRDMELLVFGHAGARVLVFPTSQGRFYDWEDRGMIDAMRDHLEQGWIQMVCVDTVDSESWYAWRRPPAERARRQTQYDHYLLQEVVPFTLARNPNPFLITTGASFGAYHAVNFALRHPEQVGRAIGMSGLYDIRRFTDGYWDEEVYFNDPVEYIANEHDPARLDALRRLDLILVIGSDDPCRASNEEFSRILWDKGIPHRLEIWRGWYHDWPYWKEMLRRYIGG